MYVIVTNMMRMGWDQAEACEALGLPLPETVAENELAPMEQYFELCHRVNEVNNDPLYCLKLGTQCHPVDYGILGKLAMFANNVRDAMQLILRYQVLVNTVIKNSFVATDEHVICPLSIGHYDPELVRPLVEFRTAAIMKIGHFVTGDIYPNLFHEVAFQHKAAANIEQYRRILGTPVRFEQARSSFSMPIEALDIPIFCADADLNRVVLSHAKQQQGNQGGETLLSSKVKDFVKLNLFLGIPSLEETAVHFGMSPAKMKRLLSEEDGSYQQICNDLREETSTHLLLTTNRSIADIGIMLGFSQPSSFVRSFKRWTGETPQQYRHRNRG